MPPFIPWLELNIVRPGGREIPVANRLFIAAILIWNLGCAGAICSRPHIEYLNSPELESLNLPFSEAVRVGDTIYLSGQLGNIPGTMVLIPGGIAPETRQTLQNIKTTLERFGYKLDDVVKCTIFLADIDEWPTMNEVYREFFPEDPPARSAVAGSGLALGARVEIECIAVMK
jgi:2-iminobutanoate/2-iminopropanoate deaminase